MSPASAASRPARTKSTSAESMATDSSIGHSSAERVTEPVQVSGMPASAPCTSANTGETSASVPSAISFMAALSAPNSGFGGVTDMRAQSTVRPKDSAYSLKVSSSARAPRRVTA